MNSMTAIKTIKDRQDVAKRSLKEVEVQIDSLIDETTVRHGDQPKNYADMVPNYIRLKKVGLEARIAAYEEAMLLIVQKNEDEIYNPFTDDLKYSESDMTAAFLHGEEYVRWEDSRDDWRIAWIQDKHLPFVQWLERLMKRKEQG